MTEEDRKKYAPLMEKLTGFWEEDEPYVRICEIRDWTINGFVLMTGYDKYGPSIGRDPQDMKMFEENGKWVSGTLQ